MSKKEIIGWSWDVNSRMFSAVPGAVAVLNKMPSPEDGSSNRIPLGHPGFDLHWITQNWQSCRESSVTGADVSGQCDFSELPRAPLRDTGAALAADPSLSSVVSISFIAALIVCS